MAENVGSVEIKLLLDREDFDTELLALSETPPIEQRIRARLDLETFYEDLAISGGQVGITIDRRRFNEQLSQSLDDRSITARARLDRNSFNTEVDRLSSGSRAVAVGTSLDDRFDDRALDQRIKNATIDRTILFVGVTDFNSLFDGLRRTSVSGSIAAQDIKRSFFETKESYRNAIEPTVNDAQLYKLNEHLSLKQKHWKEVLGDFRNPIAPSFAEFEGDQFVRARLSLDKSELTALEESRTTIKASKEKTVDRSSRVLVPTTHSLNPFKFIGSIGSQVIGGALYGVGQEISKKLGGGISKAIESSIGNTFGSTELLGEMLGKKLSSSIGGGISKSAGILQSLEQYIDKVEPETPEGLKRKRQIKKVINQVSEAPQKVTEALTREVGTREVEREKFMRRGIETRDRKRTDLIASGQASIEYEERASTLAVATARKTKLDERVESAVTQKSERIGVLTQSELPPLKDEIRSFEESPLGKAVSERQQAKTALTNFKPRLYSKAEQKESDRAYAILQSPEDQETSFKTKVLENSNQAIASFNPKIYSPEAIELAALRGESLPTDAEQRTAQSQLARRSADDQIAQFKPKTYSNEEIAYAQGIARMLPNASDQRQTLVDRYTETDSAVKAQQFTKQSATDAAFAQMDRDAGIETPEFVPVDLLAEQKKKIESYSKLLAEGKTLEKEIKELREVQSTATEDLESKNHSVKLAESFVVPKSLESRQATVSAKMQKMQNIGQVVERLEQRKTDASESLKIESGDPLRSAQIGYSVASGRLERAESRRSNLIQSRRSQFQEAVSSGAPIEDVERLRSKMESSESRSGRLPSLILEKSKAQELLNKQLLKITEIKNAISVTDTELIKIQDLHKRTQQEYNTIGDGRKPQRQDPREYIELARIVTGKDFNEEKLPKLREGSTAEMALGDQGEAQRKGFYAVDKNEIVVSPEIFKELKSGELLSQPSTRLLSEEIAHAYDMDFGSAKGMAALEQERTVRKLTTPTKDELKEMGPELSTYNQSRREIELSGKTQAIRATAEYQKGRGLVKHQTAIVDDLLPVSLAESALKGTQSHIDALKVESGKIGVDYTQVVEILEGHVSKASVRIQALRSQSDASISNPDAPRIDRSEAEQLLESQKKLGVIAVGKRTEVYAAGKVRAVGESLPSVESLSDAKRESSVIVGAQRRVGLKDSADISKDVRSEILSIEKESKALKTEILSLKPSEAAASRPAIQAKADSLNNRFAEVLQTNQVLKSEVDEVNPQAIAQSESRVESGEKAKAKAKGIKERVFNKDRNIDIDVDSVRDGVEATGKALYSGGLAAAKTLDTVATGFKALASSDIGQKVLGAAGGTANAMVATSKAMYKIASVAESVALDLVPMGRSAKGILKQTAVPALAYSAVTHMLPGGAAVAGGLEHLATGLLSPVMHGGGSALSGQASSVLSQIVPNVMGLQSSVVSAATGLIEGAMNGAIAPVASAATAIIGGKFLTGSAGNAAKTFPFVAVPPSTMALSAGETIALPPSSIQAEESSSKALAIAKNNASPIDVAKKEQSLREELAEAEKRQDIERYTATSKKLTSLVSQKQEKAIAEKQQKERSEKVEAPIAEILPSPLATLTRPQLYAVAKQEGVKGVTSGTKKDALISKIQQKVPTDKIDAIVQNIDQNVDRKGKPIDGFDKAKESEVLKRISAQEKELNKKITSAKKLKGHDRINAIESLERDAQSFVAELDKLQSIVFSGPTSGAIGKTKGRVEASIRHKPEAVEARDNRIAAVSRSKAGPTYGATYAEMVEEGRGYREQGQTIDVVPTRLARAASPRPEGFLSSAKRRLLGLVSDPTAQALAATGASMVAGPIGDGIHPVAGTVARLGASNAVKIASLKKAPGEGLVSQAKSFIQSDKAKGLATEAMIAASGMIASSAVSGQGSIAAASAGLLATLTSRITIEAGTQYKGSIDKLRKQEEFVNGGIRKKTKMLADAAREINLSKSGDAITGDIAGFAIGNSATFMKGAIAHAIGMPALNQLPIDSIASTILPGKVVDARRSFVARASEPKGAGFIDRMKDRISNFGINKERMGLNFESFRDTYATGSGGQAIGALAPRLEVADRDLKAVGADALYDVDRNVVMVSKSLARTLSAPVQSLGKMSERLKPLTHELRHSNQFLGGQLNVDQAASGLGVPLKSSKTLNKDQLESVDRSVEIAAKQNPKLNKKALRSLEVDAYASESDTLKTILSLQSAAGTQKRSPLNALGRMGQRAKSGIFNAFGDVKDNIRERVLKQPTIANIARTVRAYGSVGTTLEERANRSSALADAAYDEARSRSIQGETRSTIEDGQSQKSQFNRVASKLGLTLEGEGRSIAAPAEDRATVKSRIASNINSVKDFVGKGFNSVGGDIAKKEAGKLRFTAIDAKTLSNDIETSRIVAEQEGRTDDAKSLGKLKRKVDVKTARAERITSQESFSSKDLKSIGNLKQDFNELYRLAGRPIPHPFAEITGAAKGLLSSVKGVGLGLIALPFAIGGFGMAIGMMQKFASASVEAAIAADRIKTSLAFTTGSKQKGNEAFEYASNQAEKLGIDRGSSIEGYSKLRASAKGKLSEGQSNELFEGVASASTTFGLSADNQNGVFLALGQMLSKGSVQAEELRGQLGERLPGAFAIAARSMNMSEAQLGKQMELGAVSADQFVPRFARQMKQEFGPGAAESSQNLQSSMFRLQGSSQRISENFGATIAGPIKVGVDGAIAALGLLEKHGGTLMALLGTGLVGSAMKGLGGFLAYNGGLVAMGQAAFAAVGGTAGLVAGFTKLAATIAPLLLKFLVINAAIEVGKTLFQSFTPDDMGSRFESQANTIKKSLDEITKKGVNAGQSLKEITPSKGIDLAAMTFGLSKAAGIEKGDDLIKAGSNEKGESPLDNGFVRAGMALALPFLGLPMEIARDVNEANGGKGLATMQEVQFNRSKIASSEQGDQIYNATGMIFDSLPELSRNAAIAKKEQDFIDQKQVEKNRLSSVATPDKDKIAKIDEEIKTASIARDKAGENFGDRKNIIESNISNIKSQKESLKDNKDYTTDQKKELEGSLNAQLSQLEGAKRQLDSIDKKFGGSADIMGRFNMALSEMSVKLEEVTAKAKNAFNKSEVDRLETRKAGRKTDEFASQNTAVKQAINEEKKATAEYTGTKQTIEEVDKIMQDPTVKREISKIAINGKSIDEETSAQQLEQAKVGRTEKEKTQIDKLITRRKAIDSLPDLKKAELESEDKTFGTKSALELEKVDRKTKVRDLENKEMENAAQTRFTKEQLGSKVNEREVPVRQAEIAKISADLGVSSVKSQVKDIDELFKKGKISKEEYTKRSMDLRSQLADATTKAAQAELAVEQAKNKRILDLWEENIKKRQVGRKEIEGAGTIGLIQAQKGSRMNETDVAIKKAELQEISAKGDVSEVQKQMMEVDALRKKGVITEQEHTKRKLDMRSQLVDANIKAAEAELAIEQAKNRKILSDWERTIKARELTAKRADVFGTLGLIAGQRGNRMGEDEIAVEKAQIQSTSSKSNLSHLEAQLSELDSLRSKGVLTEEEHAKRRIDLESGILDAKVRSAEAELAIEQAKNRKIINEIDKVKQAKLFLLDTNQGYLDTDAKYAQLNGGRVGKGGERGIMERSIAATKQRIAITNDAVNNDYQLRADGTISEKEFTDRTQAGESTLRSEEEKLVNLLIQQRQSIYQDEHDAFTRANNGIIRGLESRKTRSTMESQLDGSRLGYAESAVGLSRAKADNEIARIETTKPQGASRDAEIASIRLQSLQSIQSAEMLILGLKEKQQQAALKQAEIEAQIAYGKQKIAVSDSERKYKDAVLTGDENTIANAASEVTSQRELLGLEGEKLGMVGMQNELAKAKMGIDRQTATTSMSTELIRAQGAVGQGSGIQQNTIIGGGSFGGSGGGSFGVDLSALNRIGAQNAIKPITIDPMISRIQSQTASVDRTVDRSAAPIVLDDANIVGAINKLGEKLGRLAPQREQPKIQQRQPGYSDYLEADTASAFMRG